MEPTDEAVLTSVERDLLRLEVLETSLAKAIDALRQRADVLEGHGAEVRDELARLEAEVGRLAVAIATGGTLSALLTALLEQERRLAQIRAALAAMDRGADRVDAFDTRRTLDQLRGLLTDWQAMPCCGRRQGRPATRSGRCSPGGLSPHRAARVASDITNSRGPGRSARSSPAWPFQRVW